MCTYLKEYWFITPDTQNLAHSDFDKLVNLQMKNLDEDLLKKQVNILKAKLNADLHPCSFTYMYVHYYLRLLYNYVDSTLPDTIIIKHKEIIKQSVIPRDYKHLLTIQIGQIN